MANKTTNIIQEDVIYKNILDEMKKINLKLVNYCVCVVHRAV